VPILIDGDNLLGTWGRSRTAAERRRLALELTRFARRERKRVATVFDGDAPPALAFGAEVRFSGAGRTADDLILETLRNQADPRGWLVVTSDRSLGDRCRWLGARVERCDIFRKRLWQPEEADKPESEVDVDYWLRVFGEDL